MPQIYVATPKSKNHLLIISYLELIFEDVTKTGE
jgi:hypothetical protein